VASNNQASFTLAIDSTAKAGPRLLVLLLSGGGTLATNMQFTVLGAVTPVPTLSRIDPPNGNRGSTANVTLTGTKLVSGATVVTASGTGVIATNVSPTTTNQNGLLTWLRAEGDATDVQSAHNGSITDNVGFALGVQGQSFALDGTGHIDLGSGWTPGPAWTLEAWVNPANVQPSGGGPRRGIVGDLADCSDWALVSTDVSGGIQLGVAYMPIDTSCTNTLSSGVIATPGVWYHLAATNDGTTVKLYVNGVLKASALVQPNYTGSTTGVESAAKLAAAQTSLAVSSTK
jgi:hypothetical protein